MRVKSVSEARANLSSLIEEVRQGETIVITNRGEPVARIESCALVDGSDSDRINSLVVRGLAIPPRNRMDVEKFLSAHRPKLTEDVNLSDYVIADREESR